MGWFESQIEERERSDAAKLEASLRALCDAVTGKDTSSGVDMVAQASSALAAVLGYYGAKPAEIIILQIFLVAEKYIRTAYAFFFYSFFQSINAHQGSPQCLLLR